MSKRRLALLFVIMLFIYMMAYGLVPLMPVYATHLGMPPALVGYYMAFAFAALAGGSLSAGWVFLRVGRPKALLIAIGALTVPCMLLLGATTTLWQFALLTALVWLCVGMGGALVLILAGHYAEPRARGRIFGILSSATGFGGLIGGLTTGRVADRWGYPTMFAMLAGAMLFWVLAAAVISLPKAPAAPQRQPASGASATPALGLAFYLLFAANFVASLASAMRTLGSPLVMNSLGYSAASISSTQAALGAVAIPLPFLVGWLSDRVGRRWLLMVAFAAASAALFTLANATLLWHFFVAAGLISVFNLSSPLGSALTADLVPRQSMARGIALYSGATWIAGVVGFASTGLAIQRFGMLATFLAGACLPALAIVLVASIRKPRSEAST